MKVPILKLRDKYGKEIAIPAIRGPRGPAGDGTGDMVAEVYDPTGKATDIFQYVDDTVAPMNEHLEGLSETVEQMQAMLEEQSTMIEELSARVEELEKGPVEPDPEPKPDEPDPEPKPDEPDPDKPTEGYTQIAEYTFSDDTDDDGMYTAFNSGSGFFWCYPFEDVTVGRYVSFSGDPSGAKYQVTAIANDPGPYAYGDYVTVRFDGTYIPDVYDTVTLWELA